MTTVDDWLPDGMRAAIVFTIDDVHPTAADGTHPAEAIGNAVFDRLETLLERHPALRVTLFTTPDWRSRGVHAERRVLQRLPLVREWIYGTRPLPRGTLRVDRHPGFVGRLRRLPRSDVALHGLHHVRRGPRGVIECDGLSIDQCRRLLTDGRRIMSDAGVSLSPGFAPPAWHAPASLLRAMANLEMTFVTAARDIDTPVSRSARTAGSGHRGVPLIFPVMLPEYGLVHLPTNFQATSTIERAIAIIEHGGLLSVKAHFLKRLGSYEALDGLDHRYVAGLDALFSMLEDRFGTALWWTTMNEVAARFARVAAAQQATR